MAAYEAYCATLVSPPTTSADVTVEFAGIDYVDKIATSTPYATLIAAGGVVCAWGVPSGPTLSLDTYGSLGATSTDDAVGLVTHSLESAACGGGADVRSGTTPAGYRWVASGANCDYRTEWVISNGHWASSFVGSTFDPTTTELAVVAHAPDFS